MAAMRGSLHSLRYVEQHKYTDRNLHAVLWQVTAIHLVRHNGHIALKHIW